MRFLFSMNIHIDMHQPRKQQYKTRMCFKTTVFKKKITKTKSLNKEYDCYFGKKVHNKNETTMNENATGYLKKKSQEEFASLKFWYGF